MEEDGPMGDCLLCGKHFTAWNQNCYMIKNPTHVREASAKFKDEFKNNDMMECTCALNFEEDGSRFLSFLKGPGHPPSD